MIDRTNWTPDKGVSKAKRREIRELVSNMCDTKLQTYIGSVEFVDGAKGKFKNFYVRKNDNYPTKVDFDKVCQMLIDSVAQLNAEVANAGNIGEQRVYVNRNFDRIVREQCQVLRVNPKIMQFVTLKNLSANFKPVYEVGTKIEIDRIVSSSSVL